MDKYEHLAERLVLTSDGAPWIANWVNAAYPQATARRSPRYYKPKGSGRYHAIEHLSQFAQGYFTYAQQRSAWITQLSEQLLEQGGYQAIATIAALVTTTDKLRKEKERLLNYYQKNCYRMDYPRYLHQGWMIGSEAIEAAQRVLDLRALNMSDR